MKINQLLQHKIFVQLYAANKKFTAIFLVWLGILFSFSVFELLFNGFTRDFPANSALSIGYAFLFDVLFWVKCYLVAFIVYALVFFFSEKVANAILKTVIVVACVVHLMLISYFNASLVPLGADLYGYSIADIKQTVGASGGISATLIISFLALFALLFAAIKYVPNKINVGLWPLAMLIFFSLSSLVLPLNSFLPPVNLGNDFDNNLVVNKADYFFTASVNHFIPADDEIDIYADNYIGDYEDMPTVTRAVAFTYPNENEFPFMHTEQAADVLTPFFKPVKNKPNIVILLVEGLGRAFTNEGAYLGNFTPFIDSLSNKSLYWKNFLSEGGRTFAVLPSLTASLPFAKNGFLELGQQMPAHLSLFSLLKHNGYHTSFYYGGESRFDNMDIFLKKNEVDEINDGAKFPSGYSKLPASNGFSWGYTDDQLFKFYLAKTGVNPLPSLNVVLTVATHNPFFINNQERYIKQFEQRMVQLAFNEEEKAAHRNYKLQYSTVMYLDESLRNFFKAYEKRPDYANTIFLITGDHRMPEIPMSNKIDRYHVPLIIYSPMLKRTAKFESVSTHFDITPSLLSFLKTNVNLKIPALSSWMGEGLDTARNFRNIHSYPLIQTKTDMVDFIMGEYHLNGQTLFQIGSGMQETVVKDQAKFNQVKNAFDQFKRKNNKLTTGAKIIPDSVVRNYNPRK